MKRYLYLSVSAIAMLAFLLIASYSPAAIAQTDSPNIVISQVYGGGGNQGAALKNDFIEVFNRGSVRVDLSGWTVQYASASGSTWQRTKLSGLLRPGQHYLVQENEGNGGSVALPTPDAIGSIRMSASSGKVALVNNATSLSGSSPSDPAMIDLVGYGGASFAEGNPAGGLSNTSAAIRISGGCADTNNNAADYEWNIRVDYPTLSR